MAKRKMEWAATRSIYQVDSDGEPIAPEPPYGDGWRLVSSIPSPSSGCVGVIWYWERESSDEPA